MYSSRNSLWRAIQRKTVALPGIPASLQMARWETHIAFGFRLGALDAAEKVAVGNNPVNRAGKLKSTVTNFLHLLH